MDIGGSGTGADADGDEDHRANLPQDPSSDGGQQGGERQDATLAVPRQEEEGGAEVGVGIGGRVKAAVGPGSGDVEGDDKVAELTGPPTSGAAARMSAQASAGAPLALRDHVLSDVRPLYSDDEVNRMVDNNLWDELESYLKNYMPQEEDASKLHAALILHCKVGQLINIRESPNLKKERLDFYLSQIVPIRDVTSISNELKSHVHAIWDCIFYDRPLAQLYGNDVMKMVITDYMKFNFPNHTRSQTSNKHTSRFWRFVTEHGDNMLRCLLCHQVLHMRRNGSVKSTIDVHLTGSTPCTGMTKHAWDIYDDLVKREKGKEVAASGSNKRKAHESSDDEDLDLSLSRQRLGSGVLEDVNDAVEDALKITSELNRLYDLPSRDSRKFRHLVDTHRGRMLRINSAVVKLNQEAKGQWQLGMPFGQQQGGLHGGSTWFAGLDGNSSVPQHQLGMPIGQQHGGIDGGSTWMGLGANSGFSIPQLQPFDRFGLLNGNMLSSAQLSNPYENPDILSVWGNIPLSVILGQQSGLGMVSDQVPPLLQNHGAFVNPIQFHHEGVILGQQSGLGMVSDQVPPLLQNHGAFVNTIQFHHGILDPANPVQAIPNYNELHVAGAQHVEHENDILHALMHPANPVVPNANDLQGAGAPYVVHEDQFHDGAIVPALMHPANPVVPNANDLQGAGAQHVEHEDPFEAPNLPGNVNEVYGAGPAHDAAVIGNAENWAVGDPPAGGNLPVEHLDAWVDEVFAESIGSCD